MKLCDSQKEDEVNKLLQNLKEAKNSSGLSSRLMGTVATMPTHNRRRIGAVHPAWFVRLSGYIHFTLGLPIYLMHVSMR